MSEAIAPTDSEAADARKAYAVRVLAEVWAQALGVEHVNIDDTFFELGGDSVLSIVVVSRAAAQGVRITLQQMFEDQTVRRLAAVADVVEPGVADDDSKSEDVPLTAIQTRFFAARHRRPGHANQAAAFQVTGDVDVERLRQAVIALVQRHDAMRLRFVRAAGSQWRATVVARTGVDGGRAVSVERLPGERSWDYEYVAAAQKLQESFDLGDPPLLRVALIESDHGCHLVLVAHHLIVDAVSWRVIVDDLNALYDGAKAASSAVSTPFRVWCHAASAASHTPKLAKAAAEWAKRSEVTALPVDVAWPLAPLVRDMELRALEFDAATTELLARGTPQALKAGVDEVLLAVVAAALASWCGEGLVGVDVESHGRDQNLVPDLDLTSTVGWFTAIAPVRIRVTDDLASVVRSIRSDFAHMRRRMAEHDVLRYVVKAPVLVAAPPAQVCFNYLGRFVDRGSTGGLELRRVPTDVFRTWHPDNTSPYLIDVASAVETERLSMRLLWSRRHFKPETIDRLVASLHREVSRAAGLATSSAPTPEDFPLVQITQAQLDRLNRRTGHGPRRSP